MSANTARLQTDAGGAIPPQYYNPETGQYVVISATASLPVVGSAYTSTVTIPRPSNTTAYTANDVIGIADAGTPANAGSAILELTNIGPAGGTVMITAVQLLAYVATLPSGMTTFRMHVYNASPTAILDNAAWDLPSADRASYLGYIDLNAIVDIGSTLESQTDYINKQFKLATGSTSLFVELATVGAYTPTSGAVKRLMVDAVGV